MRSKRICLRRYNLSLSYFRNNDLRSGFKYAKQQTAHYSKSFFLSASLLPYETRWETFAVYAFCRYADNIVDNPRHRTIEELEDEVEYVKKELRIAYRHGETEHPVLKPFVAVALKHEIPIDYAIDLLDGVMMDLKKNRYETFEELYQFAYGVAGTVGLMMSYVLGFNSPEALDYAEKLGIAMQLTNILRDVQEDMGMNRIYLPQDELQRFNLSEKDLKSERMSDDFRDFMDFQVKRAHAYYKVGEQGIPMLTPKTQFAIYSAAKIYRGILFQIEARQLNPFLGRVFVKQSKKVRILFQEIFKTRLLRPIYSLFL